MTIEFVEQQIYFVFNVDESYYRVSFERQEPNSNWSVRLIDVNKNETAYSKTLDAVVIPDLQLAEEIVKTYVTTKLRLSQ